MRFVAVVDTNKVPQMPIHPAVSRRLLANRQAAVWEKTPIFTIILKEPGVQIPADALRIKIDPGSKTSGLVVVDDRNAVVLWAAELTHKGQEIKDKLAKRRAIRRGRRNRKTRYRPARFDHRSKPDGWLPPSLMSRVHNIETWVDRLMTHFPISHISLEVARFDTQLMQNAHISGVEYQRGDLAGYTIREYLLQHWGRQCAYCKKTDVPLEIEHIIPKGGGRGGSDRASNLTLACHACNQEKGNQTAAEYGFPAIQAHAKSPLKDATMMNATRYKLQEILREKVGDQLEIGHGALTKFNRVERVGLEKSHWADAACVGESTPDQWKVLPDKPLLIKAAGSGNAPGRRQFIKVDKFGFPRDKNGKARMKRRDGFQSGDKVRVTSGKHAGVEGRISFRAKGNFALSGTGEKSPPQVHPRDLARIRRADSFTYGR